MHSETVLSPETRLSEADFLRGGLESFYNLHGAVLQPIAGSEKDKAVYQVRRGDGTRCILRAYPPTNNRSSPQALAQILALLEEAQYPAERLNPASDGSAFVCWDGWRLLLTDYIDGSPPNLELPVLGRLGELLGELHALSTSSLQFALPSLPMAERSLQQELELSEEDFNSVVHPLPERFQPLYSSLQTALDRIDRSPNLPHVLVHNDYHPENALFAPDGQLWVIDWDGAGRSPAIVDVGFLLSSCHPQSTSAQTAKPDAQRIHAIVDGYCRRRRLSPAELDHLPNAVQFRMVAFFTEYLAKFSRSGTYAEDEHEAYDWWLARYQAADETAALARERFEMYL
jgi:Ser/Thr protein kinase RdoA (MazF antagonist)